MIRDFTNEDIQKAREIHDANDLPENCFPNLLIIDGSGGQINNPLFAIRSVFEHDGVPAMMCFLKVTSELYFLVDHEVGTPEERWEWLKEFKDFMKARAPDLGLEQMTAFVPEDVDASFSKRLLELGFIRSPYQPYTLNLED